MQGFACRFVTQPLCGFHGDVNIPRCMPVAALLARGCGLGQPWLFVAGKGVWLASSGTPFPALSSDKI